MSRTENQTKKNTSHEGQIITEERWSQVTKKALAKTEHYFDAAQANAIREFIETAGCEIERVQIEERRSGYGWCRPS